MLASDRFVWVHVPKTGGTASSHYLRHAGIASFDHVKAHCPGDRHSHEGLRDVRLLLATRRTIGNLRDMHSHLASYYLHVTAHGRTALGASALRHMAPNARTFKDWLQEALWPSHTRPVWLLQIGRGRGTALPGEPGKVNWHDNYGTICRRKAFGLYGYMYWLAYYDHDDTRLIQHIARTSHLALDLRTIVHALTGTDPGAWRVPPLEANVSPGWTGDLAEMYDAESYDWVADHPDQRFYRELLQLTPAHIHPR